MSGGLPVWVCAGCGHAVFPARLLCPRCGASEWKEERAEEGTVEESTVLHRAPGEPSLVPTSIGTVRLEGGPVVVARLDSGVGPGDSVRLEYRDGVPVARPLLP